MVVASVGSVFLLAYLLEGFLSERMKAFCFVFSISVLAILLYQGTFLFDFHFVQLALIASTYTCAGVFAFRSGGKSLYRFFVRYWFFSLSCLVYIFLLRPVSLTDWDEFSWASFVKHINRTGHY